MKGRIFHQPSREQWKTFELLNSPIIMFSHIGDVNTLNRGPSFACHTAVFHWCNKNFVYYSLFDDVFPNLKKLVLASHPCEPDTVRWMMRSTNVEIKVHEMFWGTVRRYGGIDNEPPSHMSYITDPEYKELIKGFD